jgi:hypothetical protein
MTITIDLAPEVQAELARRAAQQGVGIDAYAASLLKEAAYRPAAAEAPSQEVIEAVERLKNFGKTHGLSLGGMTIRELRDEARP